MPLTEKHVLPWSVLSIKAEPKQSEIIHKKLNLSTATVNQLETSISILYKTIQKHLILLFHNQEFNDKIENKF